MLDWIYTILWGILLLVVILFVLSLVIMPRQKPMQDCKGKHVFITGGSTGLGKSLAIKFAKMGANVTIVARNEKKLQEAKKDIQAMQANSTQKILSIVADVTNYSEISAAVKESKEVNGVMDIVIANAGSSTPGYFLELPVETLQKEVELNYLGTVFTVKAAAPYMVERKQGGHFVLVSSAAGFANFLGYTNYGSTKRAVAALAEGLRNEFKLYNIQVSAFYPTGIDTDGFQNENKTKPEETKTMEGPSSTLSPDVVADSLIQGLQRGKFAITNEFISELLRVSCNGGVSPRYNLIMDLILCNLSLLISGPLIFYFDWVVNHSNKKKMHS